MPLYRALRHVTHGNAAGSHVCPPGTLIELPEGEAGDCFEIVDASAKPAKAEPSVDVSAPVLIEDAPLPVDAESGAVEDEPKRGRRRRVEE